MENKFSRTVLLIQDEGLVRLKNSNVLVVGLGGVGSFAAESLVRSGVGRITLVDKDVITVTNLNRQLFALNSTIGSYKVDVARKRLLDINEKCEITTYKINYSETTANLLNIGEFDYVIDAIDTVSAKLLLIENTKKNHVPVISSMGTGNRITANFVVTDIYKTMNCPLARVMRRELKKRGIKELRVVSSLTPPLLKGTNVTASISFVPPVAGFLVAGEVIRHLLKK